MATNLPSNEGNAPAFSIVVLNWNSLECLKHCLESLRRQTCRSFEVICIDNGSKDGSPAWLAAHPLPGLVGVPAQTVVLSENTGFAAGMNTGLRMSRGTWLVPLNVDVVLADDFLEQAALIFGQHPTLGSIGPIVYRWDNGPTDIVDTTGIWLTRHLSATTDTTAHETEREVFGPAGCCPIFARTALIDTLIAPYFTGAHHRFYYDELYFAYGEDVDLFLRLQSRGHQCLYAPRVKAWHVHSGTQEGVKWHQKDKETLGRFPANAFYTLVKNFPFFRMLALLPRILVMPLMMTCLLMARDRSKAFAPVRAYWGMLANLWRTLRIRRYIQRKRIIPAGAYAAMFKE